jgi:hypothetical protein
LGELKENGDITDNKTLSLRKEVPKAHSEMRRFRYCPLAARTN